MGTPGFLGRIDGPTHCQFWADDPEDHNFDADRLISVDLAHAPSAAASGQITWRDVQVDDCYTGPNGVVAGTTIGPRWPELRLVGAVYLEQRFLESLPVELRPTGMPAGSHGRPYEQLTVLYLPRTDDPRAGRRYAGHHAEILSEQGTLARVAVYPPGRSTDPHQQPVTMWIDLASAEQCDAGPDSLTIIGVGDAPKHGALFLINSQLPAEPAPHAGT